MTWAKRLTNWLSTNVQLIASMFLPIIALVADILIRSGFGIGISDAGADMCMLAIALELYAFLNHLNAQDRQKILYVDMLLFAFSGLLWILCLLLVSNVPEGLAQIHTYQWAVWVIGSVVLFIALFRTLLEVGRQ